MKNHRPGRSFETCAATAVVISLAVQMQAQTFSVLHTFSPISGSNSTNHDGANSFSGLVLSDNTLFGAASYGGQSGWGTIFSLGVNGADFSTLYSFIGGDDGANPVAGLVVRQNGLYGAASQGGAFGSGTLFRLNSDGGSFFKLHDFTRTANDTFGFYTNNDGAHPLTDLILVESNLYGAANSGGTSGHGTVFGLNTNGSSFTTLHSFSSGTGGSYSSAGLVLSGNFLYGTDYSALGNGTVFAVSTDGSDFTNYYVFTPGNLNNFGIITNSDGANPHARLLLIGNTLYGTTEKGGANGNGTLFAINTDGSGFVNLHDFTQGNYNPAGLYTNNDGIHPSAGLVFSGQMLYGTAIEGGSAGNGTVFKLNTNGAGFVRLYSFSATPRYPAAQTNSDGAGPGGGLFLSENALYGTTSHGGTFGNGTVFRLLFAPQLKIQVQGSNVILTWPTNDSGFDFSGFTLQTAASADGVFTNIPGATTPFTNMVGGSQFYRLRQ